MMKRLLVATLSVLILTFTTPFSVNAAMLTPLEISAQGDAMPAAEQTQLVFRKNEDGVAQKRLWSITYGKWLTDWIDIL